MKNRGDAALLQLYPNFQKNFDFLYPEEELGIQKNILFRRITGYAN
jgi:hypothetical protein